MVMCVRRFLFRRKRVRIVPGGCRVLRESGKCRDFVLLGCCVVGLLGCSAVVLLGVLCCLFVEVLQVLVWEWSALVQERSYLLPEW